MNSTEVSVFNPTNYESIFSALDSTDLMILAGAVGVVALSSLALIAKIYYTGSKPVETVEALSPSAARPNDSTKVFSDTNPGNESEATDQTPPADGLPSLLEDVAMVNGVLYSPVSPGPGSIAAQVTEQQKEDTPSADGLPSLLEDVAMVNGVLYGPVSPGPGSIAAQVTESRNSQ